MFSSRIIGGFLLYIPMICGVEHEECLVMKSAFRNLYIKLEAVSRRTGAFRPDKLVWQ
ncbi:Uncharacterized protein BM_BM1656 [Brugia malayi]|uniref:Bm1656 n=1 Tax=Brugia malayi TaxID=6279 RepID=A0A0I9NAQ0_BRUMA|nr:Uncharacterized protein BM_BM1656 [Brugia malayi]CTP81698.1 Bm1656 [Brugia malayi]VIO96773.1 Uncharacterized protein BM_BM1656 [Brugia malayi]